MRIFGEQIGKRFFGAVYTAGNVCVDGRCFKVRMAKDLLNGADLYASG